MRKQIAIVVDDFGEHETINAAALELARAGRVSAISCMTGGPAWRRGAAQLCELDRKKVDLGLHLDLTQYPLAGPPWQHARLVGAAGLRLLEWRRLRDEVERQFDAFESAVGCRPDHVDGHQHVHQLPQVRDVLVDVLRRRYDPLPWLRDTRRAPLTGIARDALWMQAGVKAALIEWLGAAPFRKLAARSGFRQSRRLLGVHGLHTDAAGYRRLLVAWLRIAATGDLLVTHPAVDADAVGAMAANRAAEYAVFSSPEFPDMLLEAKTQVGPMSRLLGMRPPEGPLDPRYLR